MKESPYLGQEFRLDTKRLQPEFPDYAWVQAVYIGPREILVQNKEGQYAWALYSELMPVFGPAIRSSLHWESS